MVGFAEDLSAQLKEVLEMSLEDDQKDEDGDGVADVKEISPQELARRKAFLFLRAVNPEHLSKALSGLYAGWMGILVSLKVEFAKTVALANNLGDHFQILARKSVAPAIKTLSPAEFHKWIVPACNYSCKALALIIAWRIQKIISTVQCGIKGGNILASNLYEYLRETGRITTGIDDSMADDAAGWGLAILGIYYQLVKGGSVPFPFNVLLWPMGIVERILQWEVTYGPVKANQIEAPKV